MTFTLHNVCQSSVCAGACRCTRYICPVCVYEGMMPLCMFDSMPRLWLRVGQSLAVTSHHLSVSQTTEQRAAYEQWGDGGGVLALSDRQRQWVTAPSENPCCLHWPSSSLKGIENSAACLPSTCPLLHTHTDMHTSTHRGIGIHN